MKAKSFIHPLKCYCVTVTSTGQLGQGLNSEFERLAAIKLVGLGHLLVNLSVVQSLAASLVQTELIKLLYVWKIH